MCGICGFIGSGNKEIIVRMTDSMIHRGPDESGYYYSEGIGIGHRRLKIIDLYSGQQPMFDETGEYAVTFNGEIYNYRELKKELTGFGYKFKTSSDTEVLLYSYKKWGYDCLKKFNGMFAFVIFDIKNKNVFAGRDRFGKKPLYYYNKNGLFAFASELTALISHPLIDRKISLEGLQKYLFFEYIPAPLSIIEDIYKLPAGYYLIYEKGNIKINQYWDVALETNSRFENQKNDIETEKELFNLLKKSVESRLVSDVPLGVFLSGGIDSSSVVAIMSEFMSPKNIKTFSIGFEEKSFDESGYASVIAKHFGTEHNEELLNPKVMFDIIPDIFNKLDEPIADPSIIPTYLLSKFTRKFVTVALSGDGGDELFAGYDPFSAHYFFREFRIPEWIIKRIIKMIKTFLPVSDENMSLDFKIKKTLKGLAYSSEIRNEVWMSSFSKNTQMELLSSENSAGLERLYSPIENLKFSGLNAIKKAGLCYQKLYLQNDILTKIDRASMMNSLETRAPFLDFEFAEFVNGLPDRFKIYGNNRKLILKKIMKNKIPDIILNRQKKGFGIPLARWLKNDMNGLMQDVLSENKISRDGIFNYEYVRKLIFEHQSNKENNYKELWTLIVFHLWKEKNFARM
ncbi:asparagine synthase (glutamine-hydrolyzing) [Candidatus Dependentiae bacterium]|nr:asparagine synthase (glutamine-hydrolyzing) [Candidatus Dependentiae bacterium]